MTKNLEDIKKEGRESFLNSREERLNPVLQEEILSFLDTFADTLLDACEGAVVPNLKSREGEPDRENPQHGRDWNNACAKIKQNFSTFRTGGEGKE